MFALDRHPTQRCKQLAASFVEQTPATGSHPTVCCSKPPPCSTCTGVQSLTPCRVRTLPRDKRAGPLPAIVPPPAPRTPDELKTTKCVRSNSLTSSSAPGIGLGAPRVPPHLGAYATPPAALGGLLCGQTACVTTAHNSNTLRHSLACSAAAFPTTLPPCSFFTPTHSLCRQGAVEPYTLIDSPAAWYGKDYQHTFDEWALQLSPQHIAELDAAVAHVLANKTIVQEGNYLNLVSCCCVSTA